MQSTIRRPPWLAATARSRPGRRHCRRMPRTHPKPPDLTVRRVNAPAQALVSEPVDVAVDVAEVGGETAAQANVVGDLAAAGVACSSRFGSRRRQRPARRSRQSRYGRPLVSRSRLRFATSHPLRQRDNNVGGDIVDVTQHELLRY